MIFWIIVLGLLLGFELLHMGVRWFRHRQHAQRVERLQKALNESFERRLQDILQEKEGRHGRA